MRWPEGVVCPHCGQSDAREHGRVKATPKQRYRCLGCKKTFSDRTGTVFANRNLSLDKLFKALQAASSETSNSALAELLTIHPKTAAKLRKALAQALEEDPLIAELLKELT